MRLHWGEGEDIENAFIQECWQNPSNFFGGFTIARICGETIIDLRPTSGGPSSLLQLCELSNVAVTSLW